MTLRAEVYCTKCGVKVPYKLESSIEETSNDKNIYERHKAYYAKLDELRDLEESEDVKGA